MKDYYQILGVEKNATKEDIKKAFRKLAHKYHPDKKNGDEKKFKEVNEAHQVLSDEKKRSEYDSYGRVFSGGGGYGNQGGFGGGQWDFSDFAGAQGFEDFDIGDIFGEFFGGRKAGRPRGRDIAIDMELDFEDSVFGIEKKVLLNKTSKCDSCDGSGAEKGSDLITCTTCNGRGAVREARRSIFGAITTEKVCNACFGSGKVPENKCKKCKGTGVARKEEEIKIAIPAGVENGEMVRMSGMGEALAGGESGDLYIKIHVKKHLVFKKDGNDLVMDLNIKLSDALLGNTYNIQTLDGDINIKIPPYIEHGSFLKVKEKGIPYERGKRGDLLIKVKIELPKKLSSKAKKIIEELKGEGI